MFGSLTAGLVLTVHGSCSTILSSVMGCFGSGFRSRCRWRFPPPRPSRRRRAARAGWRGSARPARRRRSTPSPAPHGSPAFVLQHSLHSLGGFRADEPLHDPERDLQAGGDAAPVIRSPSSTTRALITVSPWAARSAFAPLCVVALRPLVMPAAEQHHRAGADAHRQGVGGSQATQETLVGDEPVHARPGPVV